MGNHGRMNEWNDIAVLTPPGDIDIATVPALRRRLDALIGRGVRRVVINCQAVSFIDSTGLAFLLTRARELMRREGLLSLVNASGEVVRFLEYLAPQGAIVLMEAEHMCMTMRGVQKPGTKTVTLARRGVFETDPALEERFFRMLGR